MNKNLGERSFGKASIRALEGEGNERKFELSFSSEEPYVRWFGPEILSHADDAVDLTRLNEIGVLLFNHDTDYVLGRIDRAWIENKRGKAEVTFDDDEEFEVVKDFTVRGKVKNSAPGIAKAILAALDEEEGFSYDLCVARASGITLQIAEGEYTIKISKKRERVGFEAEKASAYKDK